LRQVGGAAEVAGRIRWKSEQCEEGKFVRQGEPLVEIDPTDYALAVERSKQELKQAENALREWDVERQNVVEQLGLLEQDVRLAESDSARVRQLAERNGASVADIEKAQRSEIASRAALLTLQSQLRMLDARHDRAVSARDMQHARHQEAELALARTRIVAPCDGTIVRESVEKDAFVQVGAAAFVMNDTSAGEVQCQLELSDMYWLWRQSARERAASSAGPLVPSGAAAAASGDGPLVPSGAAAAASGDGPLVPSGAAAAASGDGPLKEAWESLYAFPAADAEIEFPIDAYRCVWGGRLDRYGGQGFDLQTRTVPCVVTIPRPRDGRVVRNDGEPEPSIPPPPLTPGMFVTVKARVRPAIPVIRIPSEGLRLGGLVWVMREGVLRELPVRVARRWNTDVLVYAESKGPRPGDDVIVSALAFPRDGMALTRASQP